MIEFTQALELIKNNRRYERVLIKTSDALGAYVAEDIYAPLDLPLFHNSAVDGYALRSAEFKPGQSLAITHMLRACGQENYRLMPKSCAQVMTGAPMPFGADAVLMIEDASIQNNELCYSRDVALGAFVRKRGEDIKRGALVVSKDTKIKAQQVGLFLALGLSHILVYKKPSIAIICTGDELVEPPQELKYGEVYFLMGAMLKAQAHEAGIEHVSVKHVGDNLELISKSLEQASADLVLITGGMSKGAYDFVQPALRRCGVKEIFYQGAWRPAKPLYFGHKDKSYYFGVPGNPVSAFVSFRIFIRAWLGEEKLCYALLAHDFTKRAEQAFFARASIEADRSLKIMATQGSHEIYNLSKAQALCYLPSGVAQFSAGAELGYWPL